MDPNGRDAMISTAAALYESTHTLESECQHQASLSAAYLVILNVRGEHFEVPRDTLLQQKDSYFHAMLELGRWNPDAGDAYCLDLHVPTFDRIVLFLQSRELSMEGLDWTTANSCGFRWSTFN
ncbi:Aste57867_8185 [Aphanomyces stellatus]|uniref:Aste57867_8185 protein n=1 Tax=Aphanomyces stellatus TaxID=120398 RepID=A0A485KJK4_9STRA|nr:hypothetical protein As57867_008154 [Aphanomyces stellatus]VFT85073.1 Aste57867_8185 [Aphanomyces stellatus]